jgi:CRP-like cAMP-binding protein
MNLLNFLKSVDLFRELTPEALQDVLASAVKRQHWPGGHFLFRQGEPAEACYVLVSGQAHLIQLDT